MTSGAFRWWKIPSYMIDGWVVMVDINKAGLREVLAQMSIQNPNNQPSFSRGIMLCLPSFVK